MNLVAASSMTRAGVGVGDTRAMFVAPKRSAAWTRLIIPISHAARPRRSEQRDRVSPTPTPTPAVIVSTLQGAVEDWLQVDDRGAVEGLEIRDLHT